MSPRMLRVAGEYADGTVLWMAAPKVIESRIAPAIHAAAARAGRPEPRIVAGLPVAVHHDADAARDAVAATATSYAGMPSYRRVLEEAGASTPADIAIVGDEESVRRQLQGLLDAGVTDVWAAIFPVGDDPRASLRRTRTLLSAFTTE